MIKIRAGIDDPETKGSKKQSQLLEIITIVKTIAQTKREDTH